MSDEQDWLEKDETVRRVERDGEMVPSGAVACVAIRQDGTRCNAPAALVNGYLVCPAHGGKVRHEKVKVGRITDRDPRSRLLPRRLLDKYDEAIRDPELLSHRADVALLEARLLELTERLSDGESGQLWRDLRKAVGKWDEAPDPLAKDAVMGEIRVLVQRGAADEEIWRQLHEVIAQKTTVSSAEFKRLVSMRQVITAEKAIAFAAQVLEIVERHTPEMERKRKVAREIQQLMLVGGD